MLTINHAVLWAMRHIQFEETFHVDLPPYKKANNETLWANFLYYFYCIDERVYLRVQFYHTSVFYIIYIYAHAALNTQNIEMKIWIEITFSRNSNTVF